MPKTPPDTVADAQIRLLMTQAAAAERRNDLKSAVATWQQVLARRPRHTPALVAMGSAAFSTGAFEVAEGLFRQALALEPRSVPALVALSELLSATRRADEALEVARRAVATEPRNVAALLRFGNVQLDRGERQQALLSFRRALKLDGRNALAAHMVAALSGDAVAPSRDYAREVFDAYAGHFEDHLTGLLAYDVPWQLRQLIDDFAPDRRFAEAVDLGCGTGLVARAFSGSADAIDGIDIAPLMVERATASGLYRRVETADIDSFLAATPDATYDLAVAADIFIYVGRLERVFAALSRVLRPGALFAFSVEEVAEGEVAIRSSGRFAHSSGYIAGLVAANGFSIATSKPADLRKEYTLNVPGRLFVLHRDAVASGPR